MYDDEARREEQRREWYREENRQQDIFNENLIADREAREAGQELDRRLQESGRMERELRVIEAAETVSSRGDSPTTHSAADPLPEQTLMLERALKSREWTLMRDRALKAREARERTRSALNRCNAFVDQKKLAAWTMELNSIDLSYGFAFTQAHAKVHAIRQEIDALFWDTVDLPQPATIAIEGKMKWQQSQSKRRHPGEDLLAAHDALIVLDEACSSVP